MSNGKPDHMTEATRRGSAAVGVAGSARNCNHRLAAVVAAVMVALLAGCAVRSPDAGSGGPSASATGPTSATPAGGSPGTVSTPDAALKSYLESLAGGGDPSDVAVKGSAAWLYALPADGEAQGTVAPGSGPGEWVLSYPGDDAGTQRVFTDPVIADTGKLSDVSRNGVPLSRTVKAGPSTIFRGSEDIINNTEGSRDLTARILCFSNFGSGLNVKVEVENDSPNPGAFGIEKFVSGGKGYGQHLMPQSDVYPETTVIYNLYIDGVPPTEGKLYITMWGGTDGGGLAADNRYTVPVPALS